MIVAKTLQVIWGLILIGTFNCGNGYSIPIIKIIPFPALKPAFKVQRIAEISTKVLTPHLTGKKLSTNSPWDFEYVFETMDDY